jgi:murein DD-endopeptidase MepM/ murein hydrolase activator NlpD
MTQATFATARLFKDRDFFVHDGSHLRRLRLSAPVQMGMLVATVLLLCWSVFVTARLILAPAPLAPPASTNISGDIARLAAATEARVAQIEQRQQVLAAMLSGAKVDPEVIAKLGYTIPADGKALGQGGPFDAATKADPTFKSLFTSWKKLDNITDSAIAVPSDKPVKTAEFTSGYGTRTDPFQGRAARHQGIDLAAPMGTPIYATADGVVTDAGYNNGGYGNLIKVDHGRGIETRYGHLSAILVRAGQRIVRGQQIGRMGSTGRSTGSHLHYEVRIDGRAVNPIPFMKSNEYLLAMQQKGAGTHSMDAVALGGPAAAKR